MENNKEQEKIDRSFKSWVKLMWGEKYLPLFIIFTVGAVFFPIYYGKSYIFTTYFLIFINLIIIYKGFYQRWMDYINNKTR